MCCFQHSQAARITGLVCSREENEMETKYRIQNRETINRKYPAKAWGTGLAAAAVLTTGCFALAKPVPAYAAVMQPPQMVSAGLDVSALESDPGFLADEGAQLEEQITMEAFSVPRTMVGDTISEQAEEAYVPPFVINFSEQDYDVLLHIVEAEAGGCDHQGKVLVANVVINRVRSGGFPSTITEVVYQNNQFSPVKSGTLYSVSVSEGTQAAVNAALTGEDYSCGALFFAARSKANPSNMRWFDNNLRFLFEHGGHEFFTLP